MNVDISSTKSEPTDRGSVGVLFVESGETGGGSAESLYQHLCVIDRNLYRPVVVYLNDNRFVNRVKQLGIPVHVLRDCIYSKHSNPVLRSMTLRARGMILRLKVPGAYKRFSRIAHRSTVQSLQRIIQEAHIQLLHLNVQVARDLFGLFAAEKSGVPCISHLRSADPKMNNSLFDKSLALYANRVVSAFVANSGSTEKFWLKKGIDQTKMWRVHNGVPIKTISPLNLSDLSPAVKDASCLVGCVASLRDERTVDEFLLIAFKQFLCRRPGALLIIVGEGPMKGVLRRFAIQLGIEKNVVFCGFHSEPYRVLAALDVSLIITNHNSFSRIALESLLARTPLLATDAGSIRELVEDGINGVLIQYGDKEAFAQALDSLVSDKKFTEKIVESGYRTVCERFSIRRYAEEIHKIYQMQLTKHQGS